MPTALRQLEKSALSSANKRGHTLELKWRKSNASEFVCSNCNAWVQCKTNPAPNDIDIGGPAVAVDCDINWQRTAQAAPSKFAEKARKRRELVSKANKVTRKVGVVTNPAAAASAHALAALLKKIKDIGATFAKKKASLAKEYVNAHTPEAKKRLRDAQDKLKELRKKTLDALKAKRDQLKKRAA